MFVKPRQDDDLNDKVNIKLQYAALGFLFCFSISEISDEILEVRKNLVNEVRNRECSR